MQTATDQPAIDLTGVAKTYRGKVHALRGVSMRIERGEVFGLLGPNGAGKSTLVKILLTIVRPTKCQGQMLGSPIGHKPTLARAGYLPENLRFAEYLTGRQALDFYAAMAGVGRAERRKRSAELIDLVGMSDWANKKIRGYSKGMKQRMGIAQSLMNDPDLVILDEPTDGVDPVGRRDIRNVLMEMKRRGKTVFINSHLLSELEMICDHVAILVQGVVARQGSLAEMTSRSDRFDITLSFETTGQGMAEVAVALPGEISRVECKQSGKQPLYRGRLSSGASIEAQGSLLQVGVREAAQVQPILDALRTANLIIESVTPVRPTLEDLFMQAVTDPETGETLTPGASKKTLKKAKGAAS